jgi:hypothetical protein
MVQTELGQHDHWVAWKGWCLQASFLTNNGKAVFFLAD